MFLINGLVAGWIFTLTVNSDIISTTADNQNLGRLFTANSEIVTAAAGTFNTGDSLLDTVTTDTDVVNATLFSAAGIDAAPTMTNIERLNITGNTGGGQALDVDFNAVSGLNTLGVTSTGGQAVNLTNLTAGVVYNLANNTDTITPTYKAGTTPTSMSVTAENTQAIFTVPAATVTTLTVASNGTVENMLDVKNGAAVTTLNVSGAAALDIESTEAVLEAIINDGATTRLTNTMTGALAFTVTSLMEAQTIDFTNAQSVSRLDLEDTENGNDNNTITINDVANNFTVRVQEAFNAGAGDDLTIRPNTDTAADQVTINFTVANTMDNLTATNFETVNIVSGAGAVVIDDLIFDQTIGRTQTVNISGASQVTWTGAASSAPDNISATGMTVAVTAAGFTMTNGHAGTQVIVGSGGIDVLLGGAGDDQISGGAGADSINGGAGNSTLSDSPHPIRSRHVIKCKPLFLMNLTRL